MRRMQRLIAASVLVAFSGALAGCSSNISSFDPMDWLDWIDTKKKLQGERKPVFPEGVPGLEQGVPKSLYKGASQQEIDQQNAQAAAAAAQPVQDTKPKRTAKSKSKQPATASTDAAAAAPAPEEDATPAAPPAPKPKKMARQRTSRLIRNLPPLRRRSRLKPRSNLPRRSLRRCRAARSRTSLLVEHLLARSRPGFRQNMLGLDFSRARIADVLYDRHYRPAQRRKIDAVQSAGWTKAGVGRRRTRRHP
jgi:hypothetical protein